MICNECMQLSYNNKCACNSNHNGPKYIDQVSGCIVFNKNKRCKAPRATIQDTTLYSCKKHITIVPDKYRKLLDSYK